MNKFKSTLLQATFVVAVIITGTSCSNNKSEDAKDVAEEKNEQKFVNKSSEKDAQFLVDAAAMNLETISLGQLAQEKSNDMHVKELGKFMEDEHGVSLGALTELAKSKTVSLPTSQTEKGQEDYKKLNEKTGHDFGKHYSEMMVNAHKDAITLFEKASADATDPEIKAWATESLPSLRAHLDRSIACVKECAKL